MQSDTERMTFVTKSVLEELTWEWQPYENVVDRIYRKVPPGRGLRKYNQTKASRENRAEAQGKTSSGSTRRPLTEAERIASGQRALARDSIRTHIKSGQAEIMTDAEGVRFIRFRERRVSAAPGSCEACGRPFSQPPLPTGKPKKEAAQPQTVVRPLEKASGDQRFQRWREMEQERMAR